jgi:hypothetical protein
MQFLTAAAALAIIGFTSALPSPSPQSVPSGADIIKPTTRSQYEVWTGAVHYNLQNGKIFKDGRTTDITTLLTFDFPSSTAGKTCSFHFVLASEAASKLSGSAQFDVFTSIAPASHDTTTWPNGNLRDQHIGRMQAFLSGEATWVNGFPTTGKSFPCPAGQTLGGELVGTGDVDDIEWLAGNSGTYIQFS